MAMPDTTELVFSAALGHAGAWDGLVDRYAGLVWTVARAFGLSEPDAADVSQTTWLRLAEHLSDIRDPECIPAWLVTTTRREAMRAQARSRRETPTDVIDVVDHQDAPDQRVLDDERDSELWAAFAALSSPCQLLLRLLLAERSYEEISEALDMPVGSIGPTRGRCLQHLRKTVSEAHGEREGVVETTST